VAHHAHEVGAGRFNDTSYVVHSDENWFRAEHGIRGIWAWSSQGGNLTIETWPRASQPIQVDIALRGFTARPVEIMIGENVIWTGTLTEQVQWVNLPVLSASTGQLQLRLRSDVPPGRESARAGGRLLGIAVCGIQVNAPPQ
jgi:hypothetical protein